eukprot:TRINITY_DN17974_c0_g1_i2.p1 TRINITY_DN17974_c0_g1~~TRINITY_DN17974_c0_g1_i2.p1  ORF type:complete len:799 (+),score=223.54 TRINITY_DN17974_c0_g1_i2:74-2398(+)
MAQPLRDACWRLAHCEALAGILPARVVDAAGEAAAPLPSRSGSGGDFTRIKLLRDKGSLTEAEYQEALAAQLPPAAHANRLVSSLVSLESWRRGGTVGEELYADLKGAILRLSAPPEAASGLAQDQLLRLLRKLWAERQAEEITESQFASAKEAIGLVTDCRALKHHEVPALLSKLLAERQSCRLSAADFASAKEAVVVAASGREVSAGAEPLGGLKHSDVASVLSRLHAERQGGRVSAQDFEAAKEAVMLTVGQGEAPRLRGDDVASVLEGLWAERSDAKISEEQFRDAKAAVLHAAQEGARDVQRNGVQHAAQSGVAQRSPLSELLECRDKEQFRAMLRPILAAERTAGPAPKIQGEALMGALTELAHARRSGDISADNFSRAKALLIGDPDKVDTLLHLCALQRSGQVSQREFGESKRQLLSGSPPLTAEKAARLCVALHRSVRQGAAQSTAAGGGAQRMADMVGAAELLLAILALVPKSHRENSEFDEADVTAALVAAAPKAPQKVVETLAALWAARTSERIGGASWSRLCRVVLREPVLANDPLAQLFVAAGGLPSEAADPVGSALMQFGGGLSPPDVNMRRLFVVVSQLEAAGLQDWSVAAELRSLTRQEAPREAPSVALSASQQEAAVAAITRLQQSGVLRGQQLESALQRLSQRQPPPPRPPKRRAGGPNAAASPNAASPNAAASTGARCAPRQAVTQLLAAWSALRAGSLSDAEFQAAKSAALRAPSSGRGAVAELVSSWRRLKQGALGQAEFQRAKVRALAAVV